MVKIVDNLICEVVAVAGNGGNKWPQSERRCCSPQDTWPGLERTRKREIESEGESESESERQASQCSHYKL